MSIKDSFDKASKKFDKASEKANKAQEKFEEAKEFASDVSGGFDKASDKFDKASGKFDKASGKFDKASEKFNKASEKASKAQEKFEEAQEFASDVTDTVDTFSSGGVTPPSADMAVDPTGAAGQAAKAMPAMPEPEMMPPKAELPQRTGFIPNPHFKRKKRTDQKRGIRLRTLLGQDAFMVSSATLSETMSENFSYELNVSSEQFTNLKAKDLVGTMASVYLFLDDNKYQVRNGYITHLSINQARSNEDEASYRITIEPWLALLKSASNCRIYQNKSVIGVIAELFSDVEGASFDLTLLPLSMHQKYEYWVQYNESRLDYLNRICHVEGIGYYYKHEETGHTLMFFDSSNDLGFVEGKKPLIINPRTHDYDHLDT